MSSLTAPAAKDLPMVKRLIEIEDELVGNLYASWRDRAACGSYTRTEEDNPGDFTDDYNVRAVQRARERCMECPVADWCLSDALLDPEAHGVRAGYCFVMGGLDAPSRELIFKRYGVRARKLANTH